MCTHTPRTLSESAVWSAVLTSVFPSGEWDDSIATSGLLGDSDKKSTLRESWAFCSVTAVTLGQRARNS